jgi:hypothetical protein
LPFLRVVRDKRGYETTYLMHWYREGSRQRSRILYVFRTPGGVRVGRDPFEPEVLRQIEAQHPDIDFDWAVVRDNQQVIEANPEPRRRRPRREAEEPAPAAAPEVAKSEPAPPPPPPVPPVPATIQGATPDEQVAFLAEWYPQLRVRVIARITDPIRQATLLELTERLNPVTWTDADQITTGLQAAAEALERLAHVLAKRRRRARRKRGSAGAVPSAETGALEAPETPDLPDTDDSADDGAEP